MTEYYSVDPDDPSAPVRIPEYRGLKDGDRVRYFNAEAEWLPGPEDEMTIAAIYRFPAERFDGANEWVTAILNDGKYECSANNLVKIDVR